MIIFHLCSVVESGFILIYRSKLKNVLSFMRIVIRFHIMKQNYCTLLGASPLRSWHLFVFQRHLSVLALCHWK